MAQPYRQVAGDIYQVRVPLPFALRIANCYLLRGGEGWTVVDTGLNLPQGQAVWQEVFEELGIRPGDIAQIVLTHVHPDHFGMAGWIQAMVRQDGGREVPVKMSAREAVVVDQIWTHEMDYGEVRTVFSRCGLPGDVLETAMSAFGRMRPLTFPHPRAVEILEPGARIVMGGRSFEVILTPGHSDGHLVFYDADDGLMLSGDHVLMNITPNIGLWPNTDPDPLGRYLASLEELAASDVRLALPGHRQIIDDWRGRLEELRAHHAERLERTLAAAGGGATVYEVCGQIFEVEELTTHEIRFAVVEALAHLEYLVGRGSLTREDGVVWRYRPA